MNKEAILKAVELARTVGIVYIATADSDAVPHITTASKLEFISANQIAVEQWFCPGTLNNLRQNKSISVVAWERENDNGFQLIGTVTKIDDTAVLDGFMGTLEAEPPLPQVQRRLTIDVDKILIFTLKPHTDVE